MSAHSSLLRHKFAPWTITSSAMDNFIKSCGPGSDPQATPCPNWRIGKLEELSTVNVTAALIAAVASAIFSWPTVAEAPWTAISAFYASLILSLATVASASQQSIALYRFGAHSQGLVMLQKSLASGTNRGAASRLQIYVWQMPVMLLNISIMLLIVALFILIWDRAAQTIDWTGDMSIAVVTTFVGVFALSNYVVGAVALYKRKDIVEGHQAGRWINGNRDVSRRQGV
ncbi:hypothetical protein E8E12_004575 [Didymella heteroderae]|uniref:Uncharacterized protein n=1 Tax=Didymella heteroderae TaxID=1769908 RepID=A0A9P5C4Z2_9PLEO|nr:hypothetical protein E8E12_004575 [Didymella heteroderae]